MDEYVVVRKLSDTAFCIRRKVDERIFFLKRYPGCRKDEVQLMIRAQKHSHLMDIIDVIEDPETEGELKEAELREKNIDRNIQFLEKENNESPPTTTPNPCDGEEALPSPPLPHFIYVVKEFGDRGTLGDVILLRRRMLQHGQLSSPPLQQDLLNGGLEEESQSGKGERNQSKPEAGCTSVLSDSAADDEENSCGSTSEVRETLMNTHERRRDGIYFTEEEVLCYFCLIVHVLQHLHRHHIYHQELNTHHIFLADPIAVLKLSNSSLRHVGSIPRKGSGNLGEKDTADVHPVKKDDDTESESSSPSVLEEASATGASGGDTPAPCVPVALSSSVSSSVRSAPEEDLEEGPHSSSLSLSSLGSAPTTPHTRLAQSEDMWALGCLLYELLTLEPPFDEASLVDHLNHYMQGKYKPIPGDLYSAGVCALVAELLQPDPAERPQGDNSLLQHPVLKPYFTFLAQRDAELQRIAIQLEAYVAKETEERAVDVWEQEAAEWERQMGRHEEEWGVLVQIHYYRTVFLPYLERLELEYEETKARWVWMNTEEGPQRARVEQREQTARAFILSAESHLRSFDLTAIIGEEAHYRLYCEVAEEPWGRAGLRSEAATDELVVTLSFTARHLRLRARLMREQAELALQKPPPLPHLPPLAVEAHHLSAAQAKEEQRNSAEADGETGGERETKELQGMSSLVRACIERNVHVLFHAPGMKRPILHEFMHRGDVAAVRECLTTTRALDLTTRDAFGRTPLHCIFCYGRTIPMLHVILDRLLVTHKRVDKVDWSLEDNEGHDILSLAAYYGILARVWEVLKERRVRYFRKYVGRIPIRKRIRLGDWEQLSRCDRRRLHPTEGIEMCDSIAGDASIAREKSFLAVKNVN